MKKNTLLIGSIATVVALSAVSLATFASDTGTNTSYKAVANGKQMIQGMNKMKTKMKGKDFRKDVMKGEMHPHNPAIDAALEKNDYNAFVIAVKGTPMEKNVSQEKFTKMLEMYNQRKAVETALTSNDYNAFVTAIKGTPMEKDITPERFTEMVAKHVKMQAIQNAIKNNDYDAFVKASTPTKEEFAKMIENFKTKGTQMPMQMMNK